MFVRPFISTQSPYKHCVARRRFAPVMNERREHQRHPSAPDELQQREVVDAKTDEGVEDAGDEPRGRRARQRRPRTKAP